MSASLLFPRLLDENVADVNNPIVGGQGYLYITLVSNIFSMGFLLLLIRQVRIARQRAAEGFSDVKHRVLLPAYESLLWFLCLLFLAVTFCVGGFILSLTTHPKPGRNEFMTIQLCAVLLLSTYSVVPLLLTQKNVSTRAYVNVALFIAPWAISNSVLCVILKERCDGASSASDGSADDDDGGNGGAPPPNRRRHLVNSQGLEKDDCLFTPEGDNEGLTLAFSLTSALPPLVLHLALLLGYVRSRMERKSKTAKFNTVFCFFYSATFLAMNVTSHMYEKVSNLFKYLLITGSIVMCIMNLIFPLAVYKTLVADTKYWRGLGKHNRRGISSPSFDSEKASPTLGPTTGSNTPTSPMSLSGSAQSAFFSSSVGSMLSASGGETSSERPTLLSANANSSRSLSSNVQIGSPPLREPLSLKTASDSMQSMIGEQGRFLIDFSYIAVGKRIGSGSSAIVYVGTFKKAVVAIKVFSPPEITEEDIAYFGREASLAASMVHPAIVHTYGLCIRPPSVALITEFCEHGCLGEFLRRAELRQNFTVQAKDGLLLWRLRCVIAAVSAVKYLHGRGILHRDIKADNFFLTKDGEAKLGDFGESTLFEIKKKGADGKVADDADELRAGIVSKGRKSKVASMKKKKMTIVGTISNMAPEMINNASSYTEAVDIYSLAVTMWEIWTSQSPFDRFNQFQIYKLVGEKGVRPDFPPNTNVVFRDCVAAAWNQDPKNRPGAAALLAKLQAEYERLERLAADALASSHRGGGEGPEPWPESLQSFMKVPMRSPQASVDGGNRMSHSLANVMHLANNPAIPLRHKKTLKGVVNAVLFNNNLSRTDRESAGGRLARSDSLDPNLERFDYDERTTISLADWELEEAKRQQKLARSVGVLGDKSISGGNSSFSEEVELTRSRGGSRVSSTNRGSRSSTGGRSVSSGEGSGRRSRSSVAEVADAFLRGFDKILGNRGSAGKRAAAETDGGVRANEEDGHAGTIADAVARIENGSGVGAEDISPASEAARSARSSVVRRDPESNSSMV